MKIKIEVEVPDGDYCGECFLRKGNRCTHYNECAEGRFDFIRKILVHKKCPACLKACEEAKD